MRNAGTVFAALGLACVALALPALAQQTTRDRIRASLPRYDPSIRENREAAESKRLARPPEETDVLLLPDFEVLEKKLHRPNPDQALSGAAYQRQAMREYARDMNALELALNRWHIPFITPSFAQRAVAAKEEKRIRNEMEGYAQIARVAALVDPEGARAIRNAMGRR